MHNSQTIAAASLVKARVMIQDNMRENDAWLLRGLTSIYSHQTASEQNSQATKDHNGVGFSGIDAQILSSFAEQVIKFHANLKANRPNRFQAPLSPNQLKICRKLMMKYAGQLSRIVRAKAVAQEAKTRKDDAELALVEVQTDMGYRD